MSILASLVENGVNPEALAAVVKELKRETDALKVSYLVKIKILIWIKAATGGMWKVDLYNRTSYEFLSKIINLSTQSSVTILKKLKLKPESDENQRSDWDKLTLNESKLESAWLTRQACAS